ncbi:MAG: hypothetical protein OSJ45_03865 [Lachnospiraceae bacterium]|nr:hypothetical protein [Lachnospiraceae bacterium]
MISQDKQKRLEYEAREKVIMDHNQMMFESKESGREEGRKEGIEIEETQKSIAIAKNLIAFGMPFDNISQMTGLSVEEIHKISKENYLPMLKTNKAAVFRTLLPQ